MVPLQIEENTYCPDCNRNTSGRCFAHSNFTIKYYFDIPIAVVKPHKCPVCNGTGLVSRPPHIAGDVDQWTDSNVGPFSCKPCHGTGILWG